MDFVLYLCGPLKSLYVYPMGKHRNLTLLWIRHVRLLALGFELGLYGDLSTKSVHLWKAAWVDPRHPSLLLSSMVNTVKI